MNLGASANSVMGTQLTFCLQLLTRYDDFPSCIFRYRWFPLCLSALLFSQTHHARLHAKLLQSCLTPCNPVDHSLPGSSVHGILQSRILEWVAIPFFRGSSRLRNWTRISYVACVGSQVLYDCRHLGNPQAHHIQIQISIFFQFRIWAGISTSHILCLKALFINLVWMLLVTRSLLPCEVTSSIFKHLLTFRNLCILSLHLPTCALYSLVAGLDPWDHTEQVFSIFFMTAIYRLIGMKLLCLLWLFFPFLLEKVLFLSSLLIFISKTPVSNGSNLNVHWQMNREKNVVYIHTVEYYSAIKKNEIMPSIATWLDQKDY